MYLIVWKVQIGNQIYYTTDSSSRMESIADSITGQPVIRNYFKTLDNQNIYFDWNNPASWQQEFHLSISGTNYTKLVPYTVQPTQIFDKVVVYNITIPALAGSDSHTGVFFENGVEVPVGTDLKVIGSTYGPATRYNYNWIRCHHNRAYAIDDAPWTISQALPPSDPDGQRIFSFRVRLERILK
jgi:hypothetical protein